MRKSLTPSLRLSRYSRHHEGVRLTATIGKQARAMLPYTRQLPPGMAGHGYSREDVWQYRPVP
ncbi:hypothetical protein J6590_095702, partial [Homalodisca vitripennis]